MTIDKDQEATILRYHFVERWGAHTIARQFGIHHSVVERVLSQAGIPRVERSQRATLIDPYVPFILETLARFPKLSAARLYTMCVERGYPGAPSMFRARISELRTKPTPEAYLRLKTLPGEQAQMDWGAFGSVEIGRATRPLVAFVMVLSHSRQIFLRFYLNQRMGCLLAGHVEAFERWQGVPRVILYDNMKSVVLDRFADAIRFNPKLIALAEHYRYEPRPVAVYRGNEKGRVERAIRYIRTNFFAGRAWRDLADLNAQADQWCESVAAKRAWPQDEAIKVCDAFEQERPLLLSLPDNPFSAEERIEVSVGKTPYARFDLNDYSVPHTFVRRSLSVRATLTVVRILDAQNTVATHTRCYDKKQLVENPEHIQALRDNKRSGREHRTQHRLTHAVANAQTFLESAGARGYSLPGIVRSMEKLLDAYGAGELSAAIDEALGNDVPHTNALRIALQRRRDAMHLPPPLRLSLPDNDRANAIVVKPTSLAQYDQIDNQDTQETTE